MGRSLMKTLKITYFKYRWIFLDMKKGRLTYCPRPYTKQRLLASICFTVAIATALLVYLRHPSAVAEKAIIKGKSLHSALKVMKTAQYKSKTPLLVLFTSVPQQATKDHIYRNTLRNWGQLKPLVLPVLYNDDLNAYYVELAKTWGWTVLPVPRRHKGSMIPILRHMFLNATRTFKGTFYGYANGDVLFDESLIYTLWSVINNPQIKKPFLIGRRANVNIKREDKLFEPSYVRAVANRKATKLFESNSQEYFITTRNGFPWYAIPDFVIGRVGYDNWIVRAALKRKEGFLIDATNTLLCLHQTEEDNEDYEGFSSKQHLRHNLELAGTDFKAHLGNTDCAPWMTVFDDLKGTVVLQHRSHTTC